VVQAKPKSSFHWSNIKYETIKNYEADNQSGEPVAG
jgi:hypothetical protein